MVEDYEMVGDYKQGNYPNLVYCKQPFPQTGCGVCVCANTLVDNITNPVETCCQWLTDHGYASPYQGTIWSGISACLTNFGIPSKLEEVELDGRMNSIFFETFKARIKSGYVGILLMHNVVSNYWTNGGHYITVCGYKDGKYLVHDSASDERTGYHPFSDFEGNISAVYSTEKMWIERYDFNCTFSQLRYGSTGSDVITLQKLLKTTVINDCELYSADIDGSFGDFTLDAVTKYQRLMGLEIDGIVGPATWASILNK